MTIQNRVWDKYAWTESTLTACMAHAAGGRDIVKEHGCVSQYPLGDDDTVVAEFDDETAVAVQSDYRAYPSGAWPEPPKFWLGILKS